MTWINFGLFGLFGGTFLSATLIPFPSEGILLGYYLADFPIIPVLIIATIGNFLGGLTNYFIGRAGSSETLVKKFKLNEEKLNLWEKRFSKWGIYLGLLSWVPFVGDPMIVALGFFRVKLIPLSIMMLVGKFLRYLAITLLYLYSLSI